MAKAVPMAAVTDSNKQDNSAEEKYGNCLKYASLLLGRLLPFASLNDQGQLMYNGANADSTGSHLSVLLSYFFRKRAASVMVRPADYDNFLALLKTVATTDKQRTWLRLFSAQEDEDKTQSAAEADEEHQVDRKRVKK